MSEGGEWMRVAGKTTPNPSSPSLPLSPSPPQHVALVIFKADGVTHPFPSQEEKVSFEAGRRRRRRSQGRRQGAGRQRTAVCCQRRCFERARITAETQRRCFERARITAESVAIVTIDQVSVTGCAGNVSISNALRHVKVTRQNGFQLGRFESIRLPPNCLRTCARCRAPPPPPK
jgi:hypothetical protein